MKNEEIEDQIYDLFVRKIKENRIRSYKEQYSEMNNGKEPTNKQLDHFRMLLIANEGDTKKEAEKLLSDWKKFLIEEAQKKNKHWTIVFGQGSFGVATTSVVFMFAISLWNENLFDFLKIGMVKWGFILTSFSVIIYIIFLLVQKDKTK